MRKGFVLISIIVLMAVFLALTLSLSRIVYSNYSFSNDQLKSLQAFYLAEAGIERAKTELIKNPNWYTDLASGSINKKWLIYLARGKVIEYGDGQFKMVRIKESNILYSIGYFAKARSLIKISFQAVPYQTLSWEQL